eukprot:CAMPEP_0118830040 /NCGR_PEP_ID=MMETSP1162-20130426/25424_1 /TAXON_ID=33656 /ORGANISM="Phaeocystis Sp, Strain CCMP2710" /LENGTH=162 /DNA_ID=CAMNT_0006761303 /DNA_START=154 /DNA_END=643 /DNA_ORIENTATION=+
MRPTHLTPASPELTGRDPPRRPLQPRQPQVARPRIQDTLPAPKATPAACCSANCCSNLACSSAAAAVLWACSAAAAARPAAARSAAACSSMAFAAGLGRSAPPTPAATPPERPRGEPAPPAPPPLFVQRAVPPAVLPPAPPSPAPPVRSRTQHRHRFSSPAT